MKVIRRSSEVAFGGCAVYFLRAFDMAENTVVGWKANSRFLTRRKAAVRNDAAGWVVAKGSKIAVQVCRMNGRIYYSSKRRKKSDAKDNFVDCGNGGRGYGAAGDDGCADERRNFDDQGGSD
jgi:hypothetical protein